VPKAAALVWRSARSGTIALSIFTVAAALLPLGMAYAGKRIVDALVLRSKAETLRWVAIEGGVLITLLLVQRGLALVRALVGARLSVDINVRILEKALSLGLSHFEDPTTYDMLTRARREASSRPLTAVTDALQLLQQTLAFAGYAALLAAMSPWVLVALVAAAVPATLAEMRFSNQAFRLRNWRSPEGRRLTYLEYVLANDSHVKEVKLFGLGPLLLGRFRRLGETFYREDRDLAVRRAAWGAALSLVGTLVLYGFYAFTALAAVAGRRTLGEVTLYLIAMRQGQQAFQSALTAVGGMYENGLYLSNLSAFFAITTPPLLTTNPELPGSREAPHEKPEAGVRFEGVGFRYPGRETWALRGVDLFVPRGQSVALVGHNGAGKTTFVKLLTRLYEPTEGRILLDGRDLTAWDPDALRSRVGVIFQDFNRYQLSAGENVGFGDVTGLEDEERLRLAVSRGGADDVVASLPAGLTTLLGRWFRDGVELSGGQWQKVALARAFMRERADILVLDEPTAALDADAEHEVFERFRALTQGRTTFVISHRFPTVRTADRIIVLEGGHITEEGTHHSLVAAAGTYARLFALQAGGYQ